MTAPSRARLFIREQGASKANPHNGEYEDEAAAIAEGERLCTEGNVEGFEVWICAGTYARKYAVERVVEPREVRAA
jgi:hypothetical protein